MRAEFSDKTKLARFRHANGHCETCTQKITGSAEYDHAVPAAIGGSNDFENCRCVCKRCHGIKTTKTDVPQIAKSKRIEAKRAGLRKTKRPMPFGRGSRLKKKMDGSVVER